MLERRILVALMVVGLMVIGACRSADVVSIRPSHVDQILVQQDFDLHMVSIDIVAPGLNPMPPLLKIYLPKVKEYCEANKLSKGDCGELENDLLDKLRSYVERHKALEERMEQSRRLKESRPLKERRY
jgi:hypothetical protein